MENKRNKVYLGLYAALIALYAALSLGLPSDPKTLQKYNIAQSRVHLVSLAIVIPLVMVWSAALYGFIKFKSYSSTVSETPEGAPLRHLSTGLMILAFSLPILACVSSLSTYASWHRPDLLPTLTICKNYLNILFALAAFLQIFKGAEGLAQTSKRKISLPTSNWAIVSVLLLASLYIWLITTRAYGSSGDIAYFLPNWLVISTLAIPYLFVWCKGMASAYYLNMYRSKIRGKIYKKALGYVSQGIVTIIVLSISIQFITTLSVRLTRLRFTPLLVVVYVLVAFYAVGYGLVAQGAKKLKLIEEV